MKPSIGAFLIGLFAACSGSPEPEPDPVDTDIEDTDPPDLGDEPLFALCTDTGPSTLADPRYANDVQPIFQMCLDCHATSASTSLQFADAWPLMVDFPAEGLPSMDRISPGSLDESYLWHKLCGTHRNVGGLGTKMPQSSSLTPAEMEVIRSWILSGAAP